MNHLNSVLIEGTIEGDGPEEPLGRYFTIRNSRKLPKGGVQECSFRIIDDRERKTELKEGDRIRIIGRLINNSGTTSQDGRNEVFVVAEHIERVLRADDSPKGKKEGKK